MPRDLGRFGGRLKDFSTSGHGDVTLDIYSLFMFAGAALLLAYYMTWGPINQSVVQVGQIGFSLGIAGFAGGYIISKLDPQRFGDTHMSWRLLTTSGYESTIAFTLIFAVISIMTQAMVLAIRPQAGLIAPTTPIDTFLFVQSMAIMETYFFVYFFFRLLRAGLGWPVAMIGISLVFGFGYHQVVYHADMFYEATAVVGSMIYCASLQLTGRLSVAMALHQIQNFITTIGMVVSQLQSAIKS